MFRNRGSLSRQLLGGQLIIIFLLLASVVVFSVAQTNTSFRNTQGRKLLSAAEDVAATTGVRINLTDPYKQDALAVFAESARSLSGADYVLIADAHGTVLASPDPEQRGHRLPLGDSTVLAGRAWVGEVTTDRKDTLVAHVPVFSEDARMIGVVAVGSATPDLLQALRQAPEYPLGLLAFGAVLGVAGSVLLARRVKRQTLGLEPAEITGLVEHREALLHGIREGVLGVDQQNRVTLVNEQARQLLSLPDDCVGLPVDSLVADERTKDVLTGRTDGTDQIVLHEDKIVVINRMPISGIGAVITMRDRTELMDLQQELAAHRNVTDTLRAQAHEFTNRLHTISGLLELGEHEELQRFVHRISHTREQWQHEVSSRIHDPATAALLIAKASLAAERGVGLRLREDSCLPALDEELSADLVTVLGNLVDNALDAVETGGTGDRWIEVGLQCTDEVTVVVRDSGPGVTPEIVEEVFRHGFTTKAADNGPRGLGLALTRQLCHRRGGSVHVHNATGAVFTAHLPLKQLEGQP